MNPGVQQAIDSISTWLQLIITVGAVVTLLMTVSRAAQRPNKTQDERLDALEKWKTDVENRLEAGTYKTSEGKTLEDYVTAFVQVANSNGIPVCDMYHTLGFNKYNFSNYFLDTDGTHPYKGFHEIALKIESFIEANQTF